MFTIIAVLFVLNVLSNGVDSEVEQKQLNDFYQNSKAQDLMDAPISFLPTCKPPQFHQVSEQQIRCACGLQCRFVCKPDEQNGPLTPYSEKQKICRRICKQKACYRPAEYRIYEYRLISGLCRRWKVCSYHAKCEGKGHRWIHYHPTGCEAAQTNQRWQSRRSYA